VGIDQQVTLSHLHHHDDQHNQHLYHHRYQQSTTVPIPTARYQSSSFNNWQANHQMEPSSYAIDNISSINDDSFMIEDYQIQQHQQQPNAHLTSSSPTKAGLYSINTLSPATISSSISTSPQSVLINGELHSYGANYHDHYDNYSSSFDQHHHHHHQQEQQQYHHQQQQSTNKLQSVLQSMNHSSSSFDSYTRVDLDDINLVNDRVRQVISTSDMSHGATTSTTTNTSINRIIRYADDDNDDEEGKEEVVVKNRSDGLSAAILMPLIESWRRCRRTDRVINRDDDVIGRDDDVIGMDSSTYDVNDDDRIAGSNGSRYTNNSSDHMNTAVYDVVDMHIIHPQKHKEGTDVSRFRPHDGSGKDRMMLHLLKSSFNRFMYQLSLQRKRCSIIITAASKLQGADDFYRTYRLITGMRSLVYYTLLRRSSQREEPVVRNRSDASIDASIVNRLTYHSPITYTRSIPSSDETAVYTTTTQSIIDPLNCSVQQDDSYSMLLNESEGVQYRPNITQQTSNSIQQTFNSTQQTSNITKQTSAVDVIDHPIHFDNITTLLHDTHHYINNNYTYRNLDSTELLVDMHQQGNEGYDDDNDLLPDDFLTYSPDGSTVGDDDHNGSATAGVVHHRHHYDSYGDNAIDDYYRGSSIVINNIPSPSMNDIPPQLLVDNSSNTYYSTPTRIHRDESTHEGIHNNQQQLDSSTMQYHHHHHHASTTTTTTSSPLSIISSCGDNNTTPRNPVIRYASIFNSTRCTSWGMHHISLWLERRQLNRHLDMVSEKYFYLRSVHRAMDHFKRYYTQWTTRYKHLKDHPALRDHHGHG